MYNFYFIENYDHTLLCFHSDTDQFEDDGEEERPDNDDNIEAFDGPISEIEIPLPTPAPGTTNRKTQVFSCSFAHLLSDEYVWWYVQYFF